MFSRRAGRKPYVLSLLPLSIIVVGLVILSLSFTVHSAQAASAAPRVDVMQLNTEIDPASLRYLTNSINPMTYQYLSTIAGGERFGSDWNEVHLPAASDSPYEWDAFRFRGRGIV